MQATTNGEHKDAAEAVRQAEQRIASAAAGDSVEVLEEQLAAARTRLHERMSTEVESQRQELARLQQESDRMRADAEATVAQATETAQRLLREANEAADKTRHEAKEAAERMRQGASESAEQMMREAKDAASRRLSQAEELATTMLTHLSEHADTFMKSATADVEVFKSGTKAKASAVEDATVAADSSTKGDDKDGPSKWIRSALKGRGAAGSGDEQPSDQTASKERASEAKPQPVDKTPDKPSEAMVTRMVVRPLVGANTRARIKDLLEELPGVQAVKLGPIGDESFEVLVIHPREAKVKDNMLALAPDEIVLKDQKVGYLEIELKDLSWVESGAPA